MRDNADGLPELLEAFELDGHYFCRVRLWFKSMPQTFQFGVSHDAYRALKRVFNSRPFDSMPGQAARAFFVPSYTFTEDGEEFTTLTVRIEQGKQGKQFEFTAPLMLVRNLKWFQELKQPEAASHLRVP